MSIEGGLHRTLVLRGASWLRRNGFPVVATEIRATGSREEPDAIGFRQSSSAIIEVKVSRADFHKDKCKPERQRGGLGVYRFYMAPIGLLMPEEVPSGWGLLEVSGRREDESNFL